MRTSPLSLLSILILFAPLPLLPANAQSGHGNHRGRNISVSVSPASASVPVSQSQQFTAMVSGTSSTAVYWLVNGTMGGDSTVGTISSSGLYLAPNSALTNSVTVTAQCASLSTVSGSAIVSVTASTPVTVSISPTTSSIQVNQSQQFAATVSGTTDTTVNWLVNGVAGGNSSVGTIASTGVYTAPSIAPTSVVTVTAQSAYSPTSSATGTVTIVGIVHSVDLSWVPSTSPVAGYHVYRSTQSTGPYSQINSSLDSGTTYTDGNLQSGQTYYYATTAVDLSGMESSYSNVAQAVVP